MARWRRFLRRIQPQGIPWPFSLFYDALSRTFAFQAHYERVAQDIAASCAEGVLLDVGTGPGRLLLRLNARSPGLRLVGVDISAAMVARARRNIAEAGASDRIEVQEGAADRLPFSDGSFDAVVSTASIHHWKDPVAGLNEIHRVLRPSGRALIYDLVAVMPADVRRQALREYGRLRLWLMWLHSFEEPFYSPERLVALARASRFREGSTGFVGILCRLAMVKT